MAKRHVPRREQQSPAEEVRSPRHAIPIPTAGDDESTQECAQTSRFEICADGRCPIEDTLDVFAGRWKVLILWWLQQSELRFGELRRCIPSVTPKMLTQQLRQLEEEGLVHREIFAQVPPKVIYSMTERGESLRPVLKSLYDWSIAQAVKDPSRS